MLLAAPTALLHLGVRGRYSTVHNFGTPKDSGQNKSANLRKIHTHGNLPCGSELPR